MEGSDCDQSNKLRLVAFKGTGYQFGRRRFVENWRALARVHLCGVEGCLATKEFTLFYHLSWVRISATSQFTLFIFKDNPCREGVELWIFWCFRIFSISTAVLQTTWLQHLQRCLVC